MIPIYNGGRENKIPKRSLHFNPYGFHMYVPIKQEVFWELHEKNFKSAVDEEPLVRRLYSIKDLAFVMGIPTSTVGKYIERSFIPKPVHMFNTIGYTEVQFSLIRDAWEQAIQDRELLEKSDWTITKALRTYIDDNAAEYENFEFTK